LVHAIKKRQKMPKELKKFAPIEHAKIAAGIIGHKFGVVVKK
jgi:hypothetical protein